jgi:hypothetical protein
MARSTVRSGRTGQGCHAAGGASGGEAPGLSRGTSKPGRVHAQEAQQLQQRRRYVRQMQWHGIDGWAAGWGAHAPEAPPSGGRAVKVMRVLSTCGTGGCWGSTNGRELPRGCLPLPLQGRSSPRAATPLAGGGPGPPLDPPLGSQPPGHSGCCPGWRAPTHPPQEPQSWLHPPL